MSMNYIINKFLGREGRIEFFSLKIEIIKKLEFSYNFKNSLTFLLFYI